MRTKRMNRPLRQIHSIEELPVICNCAEAGLLLRVYPETVSKMARAGLLPGVKVGQSWRFRRDDLAAYLDQLFGKEGQEA